MYDADTRAGFARDAFSNTRADLSAQRESSSARFPAAACLAGCLHAVSSGRQGHRRKRECTLVAAVAEGRWISPGFAECRADLAISVSEREEKEGTPEMGTVVHRRSMQGLTRRHVPANSNHVRGRDKSAGAGRCSDSIRNIAAGGAQNARHCPRTLESNECDLLRTATVSYTCAVEQSTTSEDRRRARIPSKTHRPATRPGGEEPIR